MAEIAFVVDELSEENGLKFIFDELSKSHSVETRSPNEASGLKAKVTITNIIEMVRSLPGAVILFITDNRAEAIFNKVAVRRLFLNDIKAASAVFAYSNYAAAQIEQFYRISCKVQPPPMPVHSQGSSQHILCFNIPSEVKSSMPGESFYDYSCPNDFSNAKIYLHRPSHSELHCLRLPLAASYGVPCISQDFGGIHEFAGSGDLILPQDASYKQWTQFIRSALRDRDMNSKRNRESVRRFGNISALAHELAKHVQASGDYSQLPKLAAMLQQDQHLQHQKRLMELQQQAAEQAAQAQQAHAIRTVIGGRRTRFIPAPEPSMPGNRAIFLSGGVGDIFALESFLSDEQRNLIDTIYYGTSKRLPIELLFRSVPTFPNLTKHVVAWDDFRSFWCFFHKHECIARMRAASLYVDPHLEACEDFGIGVKFEQIKKGLMPYTGSSFLKHRLAGVSRFKLPHVYFVVAPYSSDKRGLRDFTSQDWLNVSAYLQKHGLIGVVLNDAYDHVPSNPMLINLSGQTTLLEAIEVLKFAKGFIGIDSSLSVLATKLFDYPNLHIKSKNLHLFENKEVYYAPKKTFEFINEDFSKLAETSPYLPTTVECNTFVKEVSLTVVQGLGDIFWIYQKMAPYFDRINFNIMIIGENIVDRRSIEWLRLFPKTGTISTTLVAADHYVQVVKTKITMSEVLDKWRKGQTPIEYACNQWLEEGVQLEDIDPQYQIERDIQLKSESFDLPYPEYVTLYLSAIHRYEDTFTSGVWSVASWADFVAKVYKRLDIDLPIVVLGAEFDREAVVLAVEKLNERGFKATAMIQYPAAKVVHIIKSSSLFIGFQSGLNILADNYDVKQVMIYLPVICKMKATWVKPKNVAKKIFNFGYFNENQDTIVDRIDPCLMVAGKDRAFISATTEDLLAIGGFLSESERNCLKTVYWASTDDVLKALAKSIFPNLEEQHAILPSNVGLFKSAEEAQQYAIEHRIDCNRAIIDESISAKELSTESVWKGISSGRRSSKEFNLPVFGDISRFGLPVKFFLINPTDNQDPSCDVTEQEWNQILTYLNKIELAAVVVNNGGKRVPINGYLIDLSEATSLPETLELSKRAIGYIGCSSAHAVIAAKSCSKDNIHIKTNNLERKQLYYPSLTGNECLYCDLLHLGVK